MPVGGEVTHRAVQVLRSLSAAKANHDYARAAALQKEAAIVARELQIPLFTPAYLRIPYLTGPQKTYFACVITRLLRKVPCTSWERQALKSRIFLVRTVPHTVRSVFERHSNKMERSSAPPPCHCHTSLRATWEQAGPVTIYDGHLDLLPLQLQHQDLHLRSKEPLPIRGPETRAAAIKECTTLARLLNVPMNEKWDISLPKAIFPDTGELLNWMQHIAHQVSEVAVVRVVDKFSGALWVSAAAGCGNSSRNSSTRSATCDYLPQQNRFSKV